MHMSVVQIVALALASAILAITIKQYRPEISLLISLAVGIIIFMSLIPHVRTIISFIESFENSANIDFKIITPLLKIIGTSYIVEFGSEICKDAGEGAVAKKIELAGKILILILAFPIINALFETILNILKSL